MVEIVALSPDNELPVAESLRRAILEEWPDLATSGERDRVRIFAGVRAQFEIDFVVELSLERERLVRPFTLRDGSVRHEATIRSGLLAIEVKQLDRSRFVVQGPEVFPTYGRAPSKRSVGKQLADSIIGFKRFIARYGAEDVYVHGLAWLLDMPDADLHGVPPIIAGHEATWSSLLQAAGDAQPILFNPPSGAYRAAIATAGDALASKRFIAPRDRAAVDRLTNATIADGRFEEIKGALGERQVRLAGRAGSGKSTTIALLADYVARVRQERLLVLTYHHALRNELDRLIRSIVGDDALADRHVKVATIIDFLAAACGELGVGEAQPDFKAYEASIHAFLAAKPAAAWRAEVETLKELQGGRFDFDYVCVDEAQDCSDDERDLLRILFTPSQMLLADGMDQLVRRQTSCDWTTGVRRTERLNVELNCSLRMSQNVARFAIAVATEMGSGWRIEPHKELTGGRVFVASGGYDRALFDELLAGLREAKMPPKDLLVCVPPSEVATEGARRDSHVGRSLREWGVQIWNGCDEETRRSEVASDEQVRVVQYDSMRGLEGWCTVLVALDEFYEHRVRHPNLAPGDLATPEDVAKGWVLMALTRAARSLVITVRNPESEAGRWILAAATACKEIVERREVVPVVAG